MIAKQDGVVHTSRISTKTSIRFSLRLAMYACLLLIGLAQATSIRQLSFDQVATQAQLIFEGEVVAVEAVWNANRSHIQTLVTFRIAQVLKGTHQSTELILSFVGGTVANTSEIFDGLIYPEFGENGIYFVENVSRPQLNPLVGWSQGHYKIIRHQGVDRMLTASHQPILDMRGKTPAAELRPSSEKQSRLPSGSQVRGLHVADELQSALSKEEFKREIITRLDRR